MFLLLGVWSGLVGGMEEYGGVTCSDAPSKVNVLNVCLVFLVLLLLLLSQYPLVLDAKIGYG